MDWPNLFEGVILMALSGLTGWLVYLTTKVHGTEVKLAEEYHKKSDLRDMLKDVLDPVIKKIDDMAAVVEKLRDKQ